MSRDGTGSANRRWALAVVLVFLAWPRSTISVRRSTNRQTNSSTRPLSRGWPRGRGCPSLIHKNPAPGSKKAPSHPSTTGSPPGLWEGWPPGGAPIWRHLNPYAGIGDPLRPDNKNRVLHDLEKERWPYSTDVLFVHLARGISTLMAAGTLVAIYRLGRIVFPGPVGHRPGDDGPGGLYPPVSIPQCLDQQRQPGDPDLCLGAGAPGQMAVRPRATRLAVLAGLGMLLGLGALAKFSGLLLWPLAGGTMLWLAWRERRAPVADPCRAAGLWPGSWRRRAGGSCATSSSTAI